MKLSTLQKHISNSEAYLTTSELAELTLSTAEILNRRAFVLLSYAIEHQKKEDLVKNHTKEELIDRALQLALLADTEARTQLILQQLAYFVFDDWQQLKNLDSFFNWRCLKKYKKEEN